MPLYRIIETMKSKKYIILISLLYSSLIFIISPINLLIEDSALYADMGRNLLNDFCFCSNSIVKSEIAPIFPFLIAISMFFFGDFFIKPLLSIIAFFLIYVSFHLARDMTKNSKVAYFSALFMAFLPLVFYNSMRVLMDISFALFTIIAFWSYHRFLINSNRKNLVIWSIASALSVLSRFMGFLIIIIFIFHYILFHIREKNRSDIRKLFIFILLIFLILLPWTVWRLSTGIINESGIIEIAFFRENVGHIQLILEALENGEPLNENIISFDAYIPIQVVNLARVFAILIIYFTPLLSFIFLYKFYEFLRKREFSLINTLLVFWIMGFIIFHTMFPFSLDSRYLLPITLPFAIVFSRFLFEDIKNRKKIISILIAIQIISSITIIYVDSQTRWKRIQTDVFFDAGNWIKENSLDNAKILSLGASSLALTYYSERTLVDKNYKEPHFITESNYTESIKLKEFIKESNLRYVFVKEFSDNQYFVKIYEKR